MRWSVSAILGLGCAIVLASGTVAESKPAKKPDTARVHPLPQREPVAVKITQNRKITQSRKIEQVRHAQAKLRPPVRKPAAALARLARIEPAGVSMPVGASPVSYHRPAFGWPALVVEARKYLGTNPTNRSRLWCATFMNFVLAKVGYPGTGSDAARSFASYGRRVSEPKVGAIAVLSRGKRGGHVGIVTGIDARGNPVIISGNHGHRVAESTYPRRRIIAYVMPTGAPQPTRYAVASSPNVSRMSDAEPQGELVSPITELLAAINDETPRGRVSARPAARPRLEDPRRAVAAAPPPAQRQLARRLEPQRPPAPRQRVVQQMADDGATLRQSASRAYAQAAPSRHSLPLDPALARFLGTSGR